MSISKLIKRLLHLMKTKRIQLMIAIVFAMVSVLASLSAPLLIGELIDAIGMRQPSDQLWVYVSLLIILYIIYSVTSWGLMLCTNKIAYTSSNILRKQLFNKMERLPISFYDTQEHGDLLARFTNDIDMISDGILQSLSTLLTGIFTIVFAIIFMSKLNIILTCIVTLCAPFTFFVAKTITKRSQKYFTTQTKDVGQLFSHTQEMLHGIKTLKAYDQEEYAIQTFKELNDNLYVSGKYSQFYGSLANPSTRLVMNTAYTIVGVSGAILSIFDMATIGIISSFLIYSNVFSKPFNEISSVMTQLQSAIASATRIFAIFDLAEETDVVSVGSTLEAGHITFHDVDFSYRHDLPLIKGLSLDIPAGSHVAIVGKTGAGKTTFVNLLMRFYDIQHGSITIDGIDISKLSRKDVRSSFGMVLQDTYIFEDTIHNNIAYGMKHATREQVMNAAKKSGADEFIQQLPNGYDTMITTNHAFLSSGQRQLLSITQVMLKNPAILILDEATSNMDTRSESYVNKAMEQLMQGKTSFVIAHRLSTILHSDIILVMEKGLIIEQGSHKELLQLQGAYHELYHSQFATM